MTLNKLVIALATAGFATGAYATNGMNLEGYGPIATGMGGASMAYDNGNAAMMNNVATLALAPEGDRLDIAVGGLHPDVTSSVTGMPGMSADSDGTAYIMPAIGWTRKQGKLTYGVGMFAQGGMGTKYDPNSILDPAADAGLKNMSEVGVGRVIFPIAYNASPELTVGGSLDVVWAGMDIAMALDGQTFGGLMGMMGPNYWMGSVGGSMAGAFVNNFMTPGGFAVPLAADAGGGSMALPVAVMNGVNWAHLDFSDSAAMTGQAKGYGLGGKLGMTYKPTKALTIGLSYHTKTNLDDMETNQASMTFNAGVNDAVLAMMQAGALNDGVLDASELAMMQDPNFAALFGTYTGVPIEVTGKVKVKDFQWPATIGLGLAYQVNDRFMMAMDYKHINWEDVMENFSLTFTPTGNMSPMTAGLNGLVMEMNLNQNWDDQNVVMIGGSYDYTDKLTLRAGVNLADNPIPDNLVNPLFPAIIKNHYTVGFGYDLDKASEVDFSFAYAPEVSVRNPNMGLTISHSQTNWQLMYSRRF